MTSARSQLADVALALLLVVAGIVGTAAATAEDPLARPFDGWGVGLVVVAGAMLAVRRRWSLATLGVAAVLTAAYLNLGYTYGPILFSLFIASYTAARYRPMDRSLPMAVIALGLLLTHVFTNDLALPGLLAVLPASAWVVVPYAIGASVKVTRDAREREREQFVRRRVDDERLRVAQEVHDIVGHGLAAIRLQADVALHVRAKRPEQAELALEAISRTSGEALEELRGTLGAIRRDDADDRSPVPRLARLDDLRARMAEAGAHIDVETLGEPRPLPPTVDLAGYRIVQESLTNVLRHSPVKRAHVTIAYEPESLDISVSNPWSGPGRGEDGHGIAGMRERVTSLGGNLTVGPVPGGRFEVRASIPMDGRRP